jgi:hypothetical protein
MMFSRIDGKKEIMEGFKQLLALPGIQGAINVVEIHIQTLKLLAFTIDYYSFKSKAYNMQLQILLIIINIFLDVFLRMLESMNDEQILHLSSIYYHARTCPHT